MYETYSNQSVVKKVFTTAILVAFSLFLWLFRPNEEDGEQSVFPVMPANHAHQVSAVEMPQPLDRPLLAQKDKPSLPPLPDFTYAAKIATPGVVYIKSSQNPKIVKEEFIPPLEQFFKEFFGQGILPKEYKRPAQQSSGSGVIYTPNGYIITNNHVVDGADEIEVTLNDNRCYKAKLVGSDPVTDLALLKIEASGLPALVIGNSDKLEVGEWVLAVGNPFNLCSTVTKGIVSAKSRNLPAPGDRECGKQLNIQAFIQTDAVINRGNSGGALVNLYGELVGINTAIYCSTSGSFIGYGFAIPSSLVKKVADDFIQYGAVQRVLLGVTICDLNATLAKKLGLKITNGVYIDSVQEHSPCVKLLQKEDVITQINGRPISKSAELQEIIGCAKPGDKVTIRLYRKGKERIVNVLLKKEPDPIEMVQKNNTLKVEGAVFENLDEKTKARLKLSHGVLVQEVGKGKFQAAGLKKWHILLDFDKQPVKSITELAEIIRRTQEPVLILKVMEPNKGSVSYLALELGQADVPHTTK